MGSVLQSETTGRLRRASSTEAKKGETTSGLRRASSTDSIDLAKMRTTKSSLYSSFQNAVWRHEYGSPSSNGTMFEDEENDAVPERVRSGLLRQGLTVADQVERLIERNPVILFSSACCPLCGEAKTALGRSATKFAVVELEGLLVGDTAAYINYLVEDRGVQGLPVMFIHGRPVDREKIVDLHSSGTLAGMCFEAGTSEPEEKMCRQVSQGGHLARQYLSRSCSSEKVFELLVLAEGREERMSCSASPTCHLGRQLPSTGIRMRSQSAVGYRRRNSW
eukprot:gnl/TRDRNA2_/TRDRNA2_189083_c0_seq1.p1 gnl/TRDRNA2_/TRDRNA2_189083_c0~~gnl/TRDRNA2_/TRDRNA2_189083_c0_seq1.p1  ORF type:complete len:278 (+),score=27.96 gnl/TRDRNA2_/TRDRNA2_189083_c0_seq1:75-908(+)